MLGRRALSAGRLAALGAPLDFHHGLLDREAAAWNHHAGVEARIVGDDVVEELIGFEAERR